MIEFKNVKKTFKETTVLKEMNLTINKGELEDNLAENDQPVD